MTINETGYAEQNVREKLEKLDQYAGEQAKVAECVSMMDLSGEIACGRPNLRERVRQQLRINSAAIGRQQRMVELNDLLEKNPDVARILDLYEEVRH